MKDIPVYDKTAAYAAEHNEREAYRASYKANMACRNAVSETINKNYADNSLDAENALKTLKQSFSLERIAVVTAIRQMLSDLIVEVQNGKSYYEAIDEAYTRIYKSVDPNYEPNNEIGVDRIYLDIPAVDGMMFARARKFLLEAVPKTE